MGEETEVSVNVEEPWVVACLLVVGWVACWGQKADVQMGVVVGVPSSFQKEAEVALGVVVGLVKLGSGQEQEQEQVQAQGHGTALPAAPFCCR